MKDYKQIKLIYKELLKSKGYLNWWPAFSCTEVIIGAILTQNVSWNNVEKALKKLADNNLLNFKNLKNESQQKIAKLIYSTRYYNVKAKKLHNFCDFLFTNYNGDLNLLFKKPVTQLRKELLSVNGIGEETADSIILYAANKPIFVIDTYTKRIFSRLGFCKIDIKYKDLQNIFMQNLPLDLKLFNDFHAQIVKHANTICKNKPLCQNCVLKSFCDYDKKNT